MTAPKRPYNPPEVTRVPLLPEEAVLTSCKIGMGTGRTAMCNQNNMQGCTNLSAGS